MLHKVLKKEVTEGIKQYNIKVVDKATGAVEMEIDADAAILIMKGADRDISNPLAGAIGTEYKIAQLTLLIPKAIHDLLEELNPKIRDSVMNAMKKRNEHLRHHH